MLPRFAIGLGFLILLLAVGLVALGVHWMGGTVPSYTGSANVRGISSNVDIDRDGYAIPHIHAATERDAWFGLGYAEAQDRMFQMEFTRRIGEGRLCEIFGKRSFLLDQWAHTIGFRRIADQLWLKASAHTRDVLTAYSQGINEYLHTHRTHLGFEFDALALAPEDWRPQDCFIIARLMSWEMNFSYLTDAAFSDFSVVLDSAHMKSLFPDYPDDGATVVEGADPHNFVANYLHLAPVPAVTIGPRAEEVSKITNYELRITNSDTNVNKPAVVTPAPTPAAPVVSKTPAKQIAKTPAKPKAKPQARPKPKTQQTPPQQNSPAVKPGVRPPRPHIPQVPKTIGTNERSVFHQLAEIGHIVDSMIDLRIGGGSNSFVVAPNRSVSGGAMLENDPHLELRSPPRWYCAQMTSDDGVKVIGFVIPGMPAFIAGRTADVSWGITNAMADECDFFVEKLDSTRTRYIAPNGSAQKFLTIHDTIRIRDSVRTNPMQVVPFDVMQTIHGPIVTAQHPDRIARTFDGGDVRAGGIPDTGIFGRGAMPVALQWNGEYALTDEVSGFLNLLHAKSANDARNGMWTFATPCLNFCIADARGNIAYQYIGRMPRRSGSEERILLSREGWNPADQWSGFYHMAQLPGIANPGRGYIVSANNPPTRNRAFAFGDNWEPSSRADRISERIQMKQRLAIEDIASIQNDIISPYDLRRVLQFLLALYPDPNPPRITPDSTAIFQLDSMRIFWKEDSLKRHTSITDSAFALIHMKDMSEIASHRPPEDTVHHAWVDPFTAQVLDYLRNWDGGMRTEEIAPAIYSVFLNRLIEHTYRDELGTERYKEFIVLDNIPLQSIARILPDSSNIWWDDVTTPGIEHRDSIIHIAFKEALRMLALRFGRDVREWQWGKLHTLIYRHPFDQASKMVARLVDIDAGAMPGDPTTPSQATYSLWDPYVMKIGPSMRMIADMRTSDLYAALPTGNSEAIFSDHYRDMLDLFKRGQLIKLSLNQRGDNWKRFELKPQ